MNTSLKTAAALALALGACRSAEVETGPAVGVQPAPPTADAIPAGTLMEVELNQTIGTEENRVGDRFTATVTRPLVAQNGQVVVPQGALVHGVVTGLDDSDHLGDQAAIRVNFERITFQGRSYPFAAEVVDTDVETRRDGDAAVTGAVTGAIAGAALGAVIGGDLEDILIGGALGAGAGTIISLGIGDVEAELPAGTDLALRTTRSISLRR
ncbi:MAG TPA: hypothetical protein VF212_18110 [Longimicrobiales bacterium]